MQSLKLPSKNASDIVFKEATAVSHWLPVTNIPAGVQPISCGRALALYEFMSWPMALVDAEHVVASVMILNFHFLSPNSCALHLIS